jgi:outer membrane protein OmpA-like peptidoglycan-associated protein
MYRMGQRARDDFGIVEIIEPAAPVVPAPEPAPTEIAATPVEASEPVMAAAAPPRDTDRDGVLDRNDDCPSTRRGSTVDRAGCAIFRGTIEGINFKTASAELTNEAVDTLDDISRTLQGYPRTHLTIKAHTDSQGEPARNQQLSERRAKAVVDFLARRGFPYARMTAKAYGERNPLDTNDTSEGRANNRRVELFATNPRNQPAR